MKTTLRYKTTVRAGTIGSFTLLLFALFSSGFCNSLEGFPSQPIAPANAPNVIVIMTDDVGFASGSTFGGAIPTPTMDQLAQNGLRYSNFHVNALCSPSRAALLTGRNAHAVGFGGVTDFGRGGSGYNTVIPKSAATIGQILKGNGYDTSWFGKNHNVPTWQNGPLGPFDQWASGLGFDYFYGFIGGLSDQFRPTLIENNSMIEPPNNPDYHLDKDLADHAIQWIRTQRAQSGGRPFLMHFAPTTAHGPLHAPADWIKKFHGKFDAGWNVLRLETFQRQKQLGVIPKNATLAPIPSNIPAWDQLSTDQKKVYSRFMEVYAAALAHCDYQIGRILEALKQSNQLDNTIVIYIQGDNGASPEGGLHGAINYATVLNSAAHRPEDQTAEALSRLDEIGGPETYPIAPIGWSIAMNTPYPYYKTVSSRLGALTNGMVISWPKGIKARGNRNQFTHLIDVLPTVLELTQINSPDIINHIKQQPLDGVSFAYSLDKPNAPSRHHTQYFESSGEAALYHDGWLAASPLKNYRDLNSTPPVLQPQWQLYNLQTDSSQTMDVADQYPEKLEALRKLFNLEAQRNNVLPISSSATHALLPINRPEVMTHAGRYVLTPSDFRFTESTFPNIKNRSWTLQADLIEPSNGSNGVLITEGGRFSGWGLLILNSVPTFIYRTSDTEDSLTRISGPSLAPGPHLINVNFTIDGPGIGRGGVVDLIIDSELVASAKIDRTVGFKFTPEGGSVGHDTGTALVTDYQIPAKYQGELLSITMQLSPIQVANRISNETE